MARSLLRVHDVMKRVGKSRSEVYRSVQRGEFPPPIRLSRKMSVWASDDIDVWIEKTITAHRPRAAATKKNTEIIKHLNEGG